MDEVDPAFFCPENVFFICYIHMKEKIGKNIQYLLTKWEYKYKIKLNISERTEWNGHERYFKRRSLCVTEKI